MLSELHGIERGQKHKYRFFYLHDVALTLIVLLDMFLDSLDDLDAVLSRHLKVEKHQADGHYWGIPTSLVFKSFRNDLSCLIDCFFSVVAKDTFFKKAFVPKSILNHLNIDNLVLSHDDFSDELLGLPRMIYTWSWILFYKIFDWLIWTNKIMHSITAVRLGLGFFIHFIDNRLAQTKIKMWLPVLAELQTRPILLFWPLLLWIGLIDLL